MWGLKEKTNEDNKQINETCNIKKEKKRYPPNSNRFSEKIFTCSLPVSILKLNFVKFLRTSLFIEDL